MDLIHADENLAELGYIIEIDGFDAEISQEIDAEIERNSFALTLADTVWSAQPVEIGHYIYARHRVWRHGGENPTQRPASRSPCRA